MATAKVLSAKMRFTTFEKKFEPELNYLDKNAPLNGHGFETFGRELEYVQSVYAIAPGRVWTGVDCDGKWYISNGWHHVNRVVYLVTKEPCDRPALDIFYM